MMKEIHNSILEDIPDSPGLKRAQYIQQRAAQVGFDWPHIQLVVDKLHEEVAELMQDYTKLNWQGVAHELGDLLFVCANLARHLGVDAETLMQQSNDKFARRFQHIEARVLQSNKKWEDYTLDELETFWQEAKEIV